MPGSPLLRRLLIVAALALAVGLLALGALYQADTSPEVAVTGGAPASRPPTLPSDPAAPSVAHGPAATSAIERWFPEGGQGAACTEAVGVDLAPGFRATLTVNGVPIPADQLNERGSAGGTLNQYTWGPEPGCPRGQVLRAQDNVLEACIWRAEESVDACRVYRYRFDAL